MGLLALVMMKRLSRDKKNDLIDVIKRVHGILIRRNPQECIPP